MCSERLDVSIFGRATSQILPLIQILHDWSIVTAYTSCYDWSTDTIIVYTILTRQLVWCKTIRDLDLHRCMLLNSLYYIQKAVWYKTIRDLDLHRCMLLYLLAYMLHHH